MAAAMCEYPEYPVWENPEYLVPVRRKSMALLNRQLGAALMPQLARHGAWHHCPVQRWRDSSSSHGTGNVSNVHGRQMLGVFQERSCTLYTIQPTDAYIISKVPASFQTDSFCIEPLSHPDARCPCTHSHARSIGAARSRTVARAWHRLHAVAARAVGLCADVALRGIQGSSGHRRPDDIEGHLDGA